MRTYPSLDTSRMGMAAYLALCREARIQCDFEDRDAAMKRLEDERLQAIFDHINLEGYDDA